MTIKDWIIIIVELAGVLAVFVKIAYGQGQAKEREKQMEKDISEIKTQLWNHITHIQDDIGKILTLVGSQAERIAKIEGRLNGKN